MNEAARHRQRQGLTLVETLVAVSITGVLLALAAPSARDLIARQRLRSTQAELVTDLQYARSESLRRGADAPGIVVQFGGDGDVSCYAVLTTGAANCLCSKRPAPICSPKGIREELKIVQLDRARGVELTASGVNTAGGDGIVAAELGFVPPLASVQPLDLPVELSSEHAGRLRVVVNPMGRPSVCSPGGSVTGFTPC